MTSTTSADELAEYFGVDEVTPEASKLQASYNVAPTDEVLVVAHHERASATRLETMRWGLVPFFAKDPSGAARMINARSEAVTDKPAFRRAFERRRCLLPADGFYEWQTIPTGKSKPKKQPWYFRLASAEPLALAGLWEVWHDPQLPDDAPPLVTCTIITTPANDDVVSLHDRMPLFLPKKSWAHWLSRDDASSLLTSPAAGQLVATAVNDAVNKVANNGPELLEPASQQALL